MRHEQQDLKGVSVGRVTTSPVSFAVGQGQILLPFLPLLYTSYTAAGEFSSLQILPVMCALAGPHPVVAVGYSCILLYFNWID